MTIGELSRRTGLRSSSAIRYYEQQRLLPRAPRASGRRVFDESALVQLTVVQLAREAGFSVAEIRQLVGDFPRHRWRRLAERKLQEVEAASARLRTITVLLQRLLECDCFDLEACGRVLQRTRRASGR